MKIGEAYLPLHSGYVPKWLFNRMVNLSKIIIKVILDEWGSGELLLRLSDPVWFQSLGCLVGFDYHSSGLTTVVTAALKEASLKGISNFYVAGGKGKASKKTPDEIFNICKKLDIDYNNLIKTSRLVAKVDNAMLLDGYNLYHHTFFFDQDGNWTVIQQGMNVDFKYARRYHWTSKGIKNMVVEPHSGLVGDKKHNLVINMTSKDSEEARKTGLDLIRERNRLKRDLIRLREISSGELDKWIVKEIKAGVDNIKLLYLPRNLNWQAIRRAYEIQPKNYEELLEIRGIGPNTIRALALVSEVIYGTPISKKDPIRYTFAMGGKDGIPFPIDKKVYDEVISFYETLLDKIGINKRRNMIQKLSSFLPRIIKVKGD